jgi:hypothetical protein
MPSRRHLIALVAGLALLGGGSVAIDDAAAAGPKTCRITGTAHINPGLAAKSQKFTNTFVGQFLGCTGGVVKSGSISESGTGSGSCAHATTAGTANVRWNNGQTSVIKLTTNGFGSALIVKGTFTSGLFKGSTANAVLNFNANPVQCEQGGVKTASFNGAGRIS